MQNNSYVTFEIFGINHNGHGKSFLFAQDAVYEMSDNQFIEKIVIATDISKATFYLHNSLEITDKTIPQIVSYLYSFLGSMMISLLKNNSQYSNCLLKPTICLSGSNFPKTNNTNMSFSDHIPVSDLVSAPIIFYNGDEKLEKWVQDAKLIDYINKKDKYDILFLLLQGNNRVQKYMAMYAYLSSLVKEIYSIPNEGQKKVVEYITKNCSKIGIKLTLTKSTRPGAKPTDKDDQFTILRNKIAHPSITDTPVNVSENKVNELASIICSAIEDVPLQKNS